MRGQHRNRFTLWLLIGVITLLGAGGLANAQRRQKDSDQRRDSQNNDQEQKRRQETEQRRNNERQAQDQQRRQQDEQRRNNERQAQDQQRQAQEQRRQQYEQEQRRNDAQLRQAQEQKRQQYEQEQRRNDAQLRQAQEQKRREDQQRERNQLGNDQLRENQRRGEEAKRREEQQRLNEVERNRQLKEREDAASRRANDTNRGRQGGAGFRNPPGNINRDEWQKREQQMLHWRQDEFRRRDAERERWWRERERELQRQRRNNYWRFHQSYWERLQRDRIRLGSFVYLNFGSPNYAYYRNNQYYYVNDYGANLLRRAVNSGYDEGFRAGLADRQDGWRFDCESSDAFTDATYGYDGYYVDMAEYQFYFREGFRRGYEDGYYGRYQYGAYSNGSYTILGDVLNLILDLRHY